MARAARGKKNVVKVNFKDIETRTRVSKEGDYPLKCVEASVGKSGNNNDQIEFIFEVSKGEFKDAKAYFYCPLTENSLWKLHALMTAMGMEVPEDEMEIDVSEFVDQEIVGVFTPDTYNGKRTFKMTDFTSIDDYKGSDDEKSEKKSKKDKKGKDKKSGKDEPEEKEGKKSKKDKSGKDGKKKKDKKPKKVSEDDVEDMDEDELEELVTKCGLDVDLDDIKKLPKKVSAVIKALKKADLLED